MPINRTVWMFSEMFFYMYEASELGRSLGHGYGERSQLDANVPFQ
jgi:hypothetical protein